MTLTTIVKAAFLAGITFGSMMYCKPTPEAELLLDRSKLESMGFEFLSETPRMGLLCSSKTGGYFEAYHKDQERIKELISQFDMYLSENSKDRVFGGEGFQLEISGEQFYYTNPSDECIHVSSGMTIVVVNDEGKKKVIRDFYESWGRYFLDLPGLYIKKDYGRQKPLFLPKEIRY